MSKCSTRVCSILLLLVARSLGFRVALYERIRGSRLGVVTTQPLPGTTVLTRSTAITTTTTSGRVPVPSTVLGATYADSESLGAGFTFVPLLVIVALGLGFAAQGWINQQLEGDQGLGAYLSDGPGYNKSGFRPLIDGDRAASSDPLPWLSLPKLDFVEVAGQDSDENKLEAELESLRLEMNGQLQRGNVAEANAIRTKLETLMNENGIEFQSD